MRAVIIGASGAIGGAFVNALAADQNFQSIYTFSRSTVSFPSDKVQSFPVDLADEKSIAQAANIAAQLGEIDCLIVATGVLHDVSMRPEKSLSEISVDALHKNFTINTIAPVLIAKYFLPMMQKKAPAIVAVLSARVGSISDNRLGGWYAYRASKAALNMLMKSLAIEMQRQYQQLVIVGLHPGTVNSELSRPFQKNVQANNLFSPDQAVKNMLVVIDQLSIEDSGKVFAWDGKEILP